MKALRIVLLLVASVALGTGCQKAEPKKSPASAEAEARAAWEASLPTNAQPKLPTAKLFIGSEESLAEIAATERQQSGGMMFRTNMEENESMLFVFPYPRQTSFWMKNTLVPLSAAYIDPDGVILEIHDLQPQNTNPVPATNDNIQFVLETKQGWFSRHQIEPGTLIRSEHGSLMESFVPRR